MLNAVLEQDTTIRYATTVTKFDRSTFKSREYAVVVTNASVLIFYPQSLKLNLRLDFAHLLVRVCVCVCMCARVCVCTCVRAHARACLDEEFTLVST